MIRFIALGGFLGAGKTTTMIAAAKLLQGQGHRVALVTNDQGTELVDTQLVRSELDQVGEVTGGCFCCRFEDLMTVVDRLLSSGTVDTVLAEAVGSCTDLQATVIRPLRSLYADRFTVAPLTVLLDPLRYRAVGGSLPLMERAEDMVYLYGHQLAEADIIAINKVDLLAEDERKRLLEDLSASYPQATIIAYSARQGEGLAELTTAWNDAPAPSPFVDIDYDRYAAAEAELAWFNRSYRLAAPDGFSADQWALALLKYLSSAAAERGWTIGHAKVAVGGSGELTKLSLTAAGSEPTADLSVRDPVTAATANFNARIACDPAEMDGLAEAAVEAADAAAGCTSHSDPRDQISFKPGYPRPVHRITQAVVL
jgi:Ni2+-binding GTPase involved in maturation of urease and hydrogenase